MASLGRLKDEVLVVLDSFFFDQKKKESGVSRKEKLGQPSLLRWISKWQKCITRKELMTIFLDFFGNFHV